ncbi:hypothetical protein SUGI_0312570 [Cryptomeria japonica]|nr:hypothetical protein SUGI_0312570 [Cryptomeria japonica]
MPALGFAAPVGAGGEEFEARITPYVIIRCIMAASGELMFGYDVGISGGVTSTNDFLKKFFPLVYRKKNEIQDNNNPYCKYDNQGLQLFTSSLYMAGLIATFFASYTTRVWGRKPTMLIAGIFFVIGVVLNAAAQDLGMLIIGILFANLVNYGTEKIRPWGWRLSLGIAGIPALLLTVGSIFIVETPNSLIERGLLEEGKKSSEAQKEASVNHNSVPAILSAVYWYNAIMFYAPVLFQTLGFKNDASLYSSVITGAVNVLSTIVSIYSVDKVGRRVLLLEAGLQMFVSQVIIAILLGTGMEEDEELSKGIAIVIVLMVCTFVLAFAWSWGPLGWLIPSETFPLETRSAGQSVTVCVNLVFTFVIAQAFLSMLCHFKYGIFLFFAAWVLIMSTFVLFLLPETKNVPIEEMTEKVWKQHWLWKNYVRDSDLIDDEDGDTYANQDNEKHV